MKTNICLYIAILFNISIIFSCHEYDQVKGNVSLICIRDTNSLHIKIFNKSSDTIFIPSNYTGSFKNDGDTIYLVVLDKPDNNIDYYYRYSKVFPFEIYTAKKIEGQLPDTVIKVINQTYIYNQFRICSFIPIYPDSSCFQSVYFNVPKQSSIAQIVYYKKSFKKYLGSDSLTYQISDFIKYDSLNVKYVSIRIINRYY